MIYLTGDTHGGINMHKLSAGELERQGISLKEDDYVIVTGDFGFPFLPKEIAEFESSGGRSGEYAFWIKWLTALPCTVLFVDGNHDNHDWWAEQAVTEMFGGRVQIHPHAPNVIHLLRGEVYTIDGVSFFAFGGAVSVDREYRTEGVSWWAGEQATDEQIENGRSNLERVGNRVDFVLSHTMPQNLIGRIPMFSRKICPDRTAEFLEEVQATTEYKGWFCGHFHVDMPVFAHKLFILYNNVTPLAKFEEMLEE